LGKISAKPPPESRNEGDKQSMSKSRNPTNRPAQKNKNGKGKPSAQKKFGRANKLQLNRGYNFLGAQYSKKKKEGWSSMYGGNNREKKKGQLEDMNQKGKNDSRAERRPPQTKKTAFQWEPN